MNFIETKSLLFYLFLVWSWWLSARSDFYQIFFCGSNWFLKAFTSHLIRVSIKEIYISYIWIARSSFNLNTNLLKTNLKKIRAFYKFIISLVCFIIIYSRGNYCFLGLLDIYRGVGILIHWDNRGVSRFLIVHLYRNVLGTLPAERFNI